MPLDNNCKKCIKKTYNKLIKKYPLTNCQIYEFTEYMNDLMYKCDESLSPILHRNLYMKLSELIHVEDLYKEEKQNSNTTALEIYEEWKPRILNSIDPFDVALKLSIAGNIMDYGVNHDFNIQDTINNVFQKKLAIDHSNQLRKKIIEAKNILYLGDNAGEIVFDKLFIETFMHPYVTFVVKSAPIINDVTNIDACTVGMNIVADVITNGYNAPSTIISKTSDEFKKIYASADLIISKGQGNFEGLMNENDTRIFFLMTVKCEVVAKHLKVKKGSFVVYNQDL